MFVQVQTEHDQLLMFVPWIEAIPVERADRSLRPADGGAGLEPAGLPALLRLARTGRVSVKLSGYPKFSRQPYPFEDCWPYRARDRRGLHARSLHVGVGLAFPARAERQDYGPLIELAGMLFPDAVDRRKLFWDTPRRLFGFGQ